MSLLKCSQCSDEVPTRDALRYHQSVAHDLECVLRSGSRTVVLKRTNGVFKCKCGSTSVSSRGLHSHKSCFFGDETPRASATSVDSTDPRSHTAETFEPIAPSTSLTTPSPTLLTKYNFVYRTEYNLLVCIPCNHVLGKSFSNHAKENHSVYISARDQQAIKATCFREESPYRSSDRPPLPPLDFVETFDGFKCVSCNYYTRVQRHAESHAQKLHGNDRVVSCKVQTLATSSACFLQEVFRRSRGHS